MQNRTFVLMQDLPDIKKGRLFIPDPNVDSTFGPGYISSEPNPTGGEYWYSNHFVETNPDWFEEVTVSYFKDNSYVPGEVLFQANTGEVRSFTRVELYNKLFK